MHSLDFVEDEAIRNRFHGFAAWWEDTRQRSGELTPKRSDLRPGDLMRELPNLFILEIRKPDEVFIRLWGTGVVEMLGRDLTGSNLMDYYTAEAGRFYGCFLEAMASTPCGGYTDRRVEVEDKYAFDVPSLQLPLRDNDGKVKMVVGMALKGEARSWQPTRMGPPLMAFQMNDCRFLDIGAGMPGVEASQRAGCIPKSGKSSTRGRPSSRPAAGHNIDIR